MRAGRNDRAGTLDSAVAPCLRHGSADTGTADTGKDGAWDGRCCSCPARLPAAVARATLGFDGGRALAGAISPDSVSRTSTCRRSCPPSPAPTHGYDVVDHAAVDPERGGAEGARRAVAAAAHAAARRPRRHRARTTSASPPRDANAWWWDLLTHGRGLAVRRGVRHRLGAPAAARLRCPVLGDERRRLDELARRATTSCATTSTASRSPRDGPATARRRARSTTGSTTSWSTGGVPTPT